jgi:hypothetical protein
MDRQGHYAAMLYQSRAYSKYDLVHTGRPQFVVGKWSMAGEFTTRNSLFCSLTLFEMWVVSGPFDDTESSEQRPLSTL